jgi:nitronate monooxygenase
MNRSTNLPLVIQGGMGIAVSGWQLARAVSRRGQLGVVSGTALDSLIVRRLQDGDEGGHVRRALAAFPWPAVSERILKRYFLPNGREPGLPYALLPMYRHGSAPARHEVTVLAAFTEVWLAREGHDGIVGTNLLTKVQMPTLPTLYGALLAGVDYVLMGAGIPKDIPGVLDRLAVHESVSLRLDVEDADRDTAVMLEFDPRSYWADAPAPLQRPRFLPIVSASSLANMLAKKSNGRVDGFIVERPVAGGHNAPPRGSSGATSGEVVYGERDVVDLEQMRRIGLPFWLAGGTGTPDALGAALQAGAAGIQVGTLFAYCDESGLDATLKRQVLARAVTGDLRVLTDPRASPTGYPFKVVPLQGTQSDAESYAARERICDLGYLRVAYKTESGRIDYRCPAEPVDTFVKKGGSVEETVNRKCLCNALFADVGMPQARGGDDVELPLVTSGDELTRIQSFLSGRDSFTAGDVLDYLMAEAVH